MKKTFYYKNALITYYTYGDGVPVMLLHGFGETSFVWHKQVYNLSKTNKVIVPDLPGSGESELPEVQSKNLSISHLANAVHAIIQNENIEQCIMLGHSMGGYITLAFAEKYPSLLKAFGFVHSTAFADTEEKKQNRKKSIAAMESYGGNAFLKTAMPGLFASGFKQKHANVIAELISEAKKNSTENLQQYYTAMMNRKDKTHVLKNNKLPVLFVIGTEDNAAPLSDVLKQVHLPEISYIHIIKKSGHMSMLEKPIILNRILKNFVNA